MAATAIGRKNCEPSGICWTSKCAFMAEQDIEPSDVYRDIARHRVIPACLRNGTAKLRCQQ